MRLFRVCSLLMVIAPVGAFSQSGTNPTGTAASKAQQLPSATARSEEEIRAEGAKWHAECMRDWDRQTHMTKQEWARTCQRVVDDRVQWLRGLGKQ